MVKEAEQPAELCPVDPATRAAWLQSHGSKAAFPGVTIEASEASKGNNCDSKMVDQSSPPPPKAGLFSWFFSSPAPTPPTPSNGLRTDREISTIPRGSPVDTSPGAKPANSEKEGGVSASGNWIYPSEKLFFDAMKRKGWDADAANMKTVVPIHNAVNERVWKEIKEWERPYGAEKDCGGPRLDSFLGLSTSMSPKARFNALLGYTAPFDRHDWVVDRCGTKVEYLIDFYAGRDDGKGDGKLSFYLDVRPKLNSWLGWKMRINRQLGFT